MSTNAEAADALQDALFNKLKTALAGVATVCDHVTQGTTGDYVEIGDISTSDWGTKDSEGTEHLIELHVWSSAHRGRKNVRAIQRIIHDTLHEQESGLTVTDNNVVVLRLDDSPSDVERMDDGVTYHGISRYKALLSFTG